MEPHVIRDRNFVFGTTEKNTLKTSSTKYHLIHVQMSNEILQNNT